MIPRLQQRNFPWDDQTDPTILQFDLDCIFPLDKLSSP